MKTKIFLISILPLFHILLMYSQDNIDTILNQIEANNTTLDALRKTAEVEKLENKTGIYLSNPEVDFGYLWGKPDPIGNRVDFSAIQSFDIPTISGMRNRLADKQNISVELQFKVERMNILLEAKMLCLDLIYYNSLKRELETRILHAQNIADIYEIRLSKGDTNILDNNKAQLNLTTIKGEFSRIEIERNALLSELMRLNGGVELTITNDEYDPKLLPPNFNEWILQAEQMNPYLAYAKHEIEVNQALVSINRAGNLPSFTAGFISEKIAGEHFQGLQVGLTIPLWENKNRVAMAKASVSAAEARQNDGVQKFYNQIKVQYDRALGLNTIAQDYRTLLNNSRNAELLKKALDLGEISLLEYFTELTLFYNLVEVTLKAERDYQQAVALLYGVEL